MAKQSFDMFNNSYKNPSVMPVEFLVKGEMLCNEKNIYGH